MTRCIEASSPPAGLTVHLVAGHTVDLHIAGMTAGTLHWADGRRVEVAPALPGTASVDGLGWSLDGDLTAQLRAAGVAYVQLVADDRVLMAGDVAWHSGWRGSCQPHQRVVYVSGPPGGPGIGIADVTAVDGVATITLTNGSVRTIDLPPGPPGHSPVVGLSGDRLTVDGVPVGGSLRGPAGPPGGPGAVATQSSYLIVGPGRPDMPETTGGTITGSEPVGAEYRSTDGAGTGAWVWMKHGTKWVVTSGDTGFRNLNISATRPEYPAGTILKLRRIGETVTVVTDNVVWGEGIANTGEGAHVVPGSGFGPRGKIFAGIYDGAATTFGTQTGSAMAFSSRGQLNIRLQHDANKQLAFELRWDTEQAWPTTLPGTPG